jgi:hypothetical protein
MSLLDDVGPASWASGLALAAFADPEVRRVPGGIASFMWQGIAQTWVEQGLPGRTPSMQEVNRLVGWAGATWRAQQSLEGSLTRALQLNEPQAIEARHISPDLDARDLGQLPLGPAYRLRAEAQVLREGELVSEWMTVTLGQLPPVTTAELLDVATTAADEIFSGYAAQFADFTGHFVLSSY